MNIEKFFPPAMKKKPGSKEYAGPCPICEGKDRFIIWPDTRKGFRYMCRCCGVKGDAIQFLREFQGMTYREALLTLGVKMRSDINFPSFARENKKLVSLKRGCATSEWRRAAFDFMNKAQSELNSEAAKKALAERGLTVDTALACNLGYIPYDLRYPRKDWGLENLEGPNGHTFVIPRGIVIAIKDNYGFTGIEVRCRNWRQGVDWPPKFRAVPGGVDSCFQTPVCDCLQYACITESALDACLIWQETGGMMGTMVAVSPRGASKGFDAKTIDLLRDIKPIIGIPDDDPAGWKAAKKWASIFPGIKFWPPIAKDPGEMWKEGKDLHRWLEAFFVTGGVIPNE